MSRISHAKPMSAFDHVAQLLEQAGGRDGIISRDDASTLVRQLEAEGQGTAALAARRVFQEIDAIDAGVGHRVTKFDLGQFKAVLADRIDQADRNRNGLSRTERDSLTVTGQALVQLGEMLAMNKAPGRMAHRVPELGLLHTAGLLRAAAGPDLVTSRADMARLTNDLKAQGRGVEALAVETFGKFIDARDAAPGARITDADITKAVDYARKEMLADYDDNANGYSAVELDKMSKTAKAFTTIGQAIDKGVIPSVMPREGAEFRSVLAGLINDQRFDQWGSEADMPMQAVHREGNFGEVNEASFRAAFGIRNKPIEFQRGFTKDDLQTFIMSNNQEWLQGQGYVETEAATAAAVQTSSMLRSLRDVTAFITGTEGESSRTTYIVGRAPDDSMVGIRTNLIWT